MHLIEKHHIDIQCSEKAFAHLLKDELSGVFEHELYPKLEQLLDRYDVADRVWSIAHLSVDIPSISQKNWKEELIENTLFQIEEYLKQHASPTFGEEQTVRDNLLGISKQDSLYELLLHYLKKGFLPTNALLERLDVLFEEVELDVPHWEQMQLEIQKDATALLRWTLNVPEDLKQRFYQVMTPPKTWKEIKGSLKKGPSSSVQKKTPAVDAEKLKFAEFVYWVVVFQRNELWLKEEATLDSIIAYASSHFQLYPEDLLNMVNALVEGVGTKEVPMLSKFILHLKTYMVENEDIIFNKQEEQEEEEPKDEIEAILEALKGNQESTSSSAVKERANYIENAGLVLLHPFLKPLFQKLEYLEEAKWKSVKLQHRAVLLSQYMINYDIKIFESQLVLNKILCGVKPTDTVAVDWEITKEEREQCDALLQSVIEHWAILKNTSVAAFQDTFLKRNGKLLEYKENTYELTVEQKGLDILLDHLPWGIGTIKTPWMEHYLSCYWN